MNIGIMQPYFFPYFGYFQLIHAVDIYVNLDHVSFMKRSYMTRNYIKNEIKIGINVHSASQNKRCKDIKVNFNDNYCEKFFKTVKSQYSKSPYFDEIFSNVLEPEFFEREVSVSEFNINIIKRIVSYLGINTKIIDTSENITEQNKGEGLIEISKYYGATNYVNAIGGKKLYNKSDFAKKNLNLLFVDMGDVEFSNKYASILDLLLTYPKEHLEEQIKKYTLI